MSEGDMSDEARKMLERLDERLRQAQDLCDQAGAMVEAARADMRRTLEVELVTMLCRQEAAAVTMGGTEQTGDDYPNGYRTAASCSNRPDPYASLLDLYYSHMGRATDRRMSDLRDAQLFFCRVLQLATDEFGRRWQINAPICWRDGYVPTEWSKRPDEKAK